MSYHNKFVKVEVDRGHSWRGDGAVSYTHLTLPTKA